MGNKRLVSMKEEINLPDPTNALCPLPHADAERWADLQKLLKNSIKRYEDLLAVISRVSAQEAPAMAPLKEGRRSSGSFSGSSPQRESSITNVVRNLSLPTLAAATYSLAGKDPNFWTVTMKYMQQLVLDLPELFPEKAVPFLAIKSSVTLTARQSACLIACGFFCIYPVQRTVKTPIGTILELGSLNFEPLFASFRPDSVAKLLCIYAYFTSHAQHKPDWNVTLSRHETDLKALPDWQTSTKQLTPLHVSAKPQGERMSDVPGIDPNAGVKGKPAFLCFASKLPGGKVLGDGSTQEELAFAMRPDALLALLLCAPLMDQSALYIIGAIKYGEIGRKNNVLEYAGEADADDDELILDEKGRPHAYLVCIDPTPFQTFADQKPAGFPDMGIPFTNVLQLHEKYAMRELNKLYAAYCAYFTFNRPTATGPWGCGPAFSGVPELKLLLQWMAASEAGAVISYAMHPESKLETSAEWADGALSAETILRIRNHINSECKTVGDVWRLFVQARELYGKFPGVEWLLVKCPPLPPPVAKKPAAAPGK